MAAIDDSANVVLHRYKNKQWVIEKHSFPASMDGFEEIRKYFGYIENLTTSEFPDHMEVYRKKKWDKASFSYAVILTFFGDHGPLIICDTFIDLLNLMNEVNGLTSMLLNNSIYHIENNIKSIQNDVNDIETNVDLMKRELGLDIERVGNLIETGIGRIIKNYKNEIINELRKNKDNN